MFEMEDRHFWFVSRRNLLVELIKSLNILDPKILDIGAGTGGNIAVLEKFGEVRGIEPSERAIEFCQERGLKNIERGSIENLNFRDRTFDIVTCLDVLEHVSSPAIGLRELKRVLKDEGKIIITVPAFRSLWSRHDEALNHLRRYDKKDLIGDLEAAGLRVETIGYFFFLSYFVIAPARILGRFFARRSGPKSDTLILPPKPLNGLLKLWFYLEAKIAVRFGLPFGTTIYAIASRSGAS